MAENIEIMATAIPLEQGDSFAVMPHSGTASLRLPRDGGLR